MPAKGWRKDEQESNLETAMSNQKVSLDSILFPRLTVNKLAKKALQEDSNGENPMILAKESQVVIQRSAVVFVNYIYHTAKQSVKARGRKVVKAEDIIQAMKTTYFDSFVPILEQELDKFNRRKELKKQEKQAANAKKEEAKKAASAGTASVDTVEIGDENNGEAADETNDTTITTDNGSNNKRIKLDKPQSNETTISDNTEDDNDRTVASSPAPPESTQPESVVID